MKLTFTTYMRLMAVSMAAPVLMSPVLSAMDNDGLDGDAPPPLPALNNPKDPPQHNPAKPAADPDKKKRAGELEKLLDELKEQRPDITHPNKDEWLGYVGTAKETLQPFIQKYPGTEESARANYKIWEIQKVAKQTEEPDFLFAAADAAQGGDEGSVTILLEGAMTAAKGGDFDAADKYAARLQNAQVSKEKQLEIFMLMGQLALNNPNRGGPENVAAALNYADQAGKIDAEKGMMIAAQAAAFAAQIDDNPSMEKAMKACAASKNPQIQGLLTKLKLKAEIAVGKPAPDFEVTDITGKSFKLSDYRGRVVLIDFWASWCPPCRAEMPNVVAIQKKYAGPKFAILGVSLDHETAPMNDFMKKADMTWRMIYDADQKEKSIAEQYFVSSIPRTILIDEKGKIVAIGLRENDLADGVDAAVKACPEPKPVEHIEKPAKSEKSDDKGAMAPQSGAAPATGAISGAAAGGGKVVQTVTSSDGKTTETVTIQPAQ